MKWLSILLATFLLGGMLLGATVAYADDGDEGPGLDVDITVVGDNADVGVDLYGDGNTAEVNFHSENPTVWINGQNINEPTVIHQGGGVSGSWVKKRINQVIEPLYSFAGEAQAKISLFADGLAKVILKTYGYDDDLSDISGDLARHDEELDIQKARLASLEAREAGHYAALLSYATALQQDYNRKLAILIGAFSLVVIGLGAGLGVLWRRTRAL